ncbi:MAG: hypothetical protein QN122_13065 [Armatimonadota bacterium]|nr:hypothetical protein [Armatimonadota bacterium]MDR7528909.1 hypothetical protein [Armatimonadota bacterium]
MTSAAVAERATKTQEGLFGATTGALSWRQAAGILGMAARSLRR